MWPKWSPLPRHCIWHFYYLGLVPMLGAPGQWQAALLGPIPKPTLVSPHRGPGCSRLRHTAGPPQRHKLILRDMQGFVHKLTRGSTADPTLCYASHHVGELSEANGKDSILRPIDHPFSKADRASAAVSSSFYGHGC